MNSSRALTLFALVSLAASTGCSTLSLQRSRLDGVKRAAVIGYSADVEIGKSSQPRGQAGGVGNMINAVNTMDKMSSGALTEERLQQATSTYDLLLGHLGEGTGWQWTGREALTSTAAYQAAYQSHKSSMAGLTNTMGNARTVPNLMMPHSAQGMSSAERNALMDALKVDALAVVRVRFVSGGSTGFAINGMGKTGVLPKAVVDLTVWDRQGEEPIWRDNGAQGEAASVGVETTMGVVNDSQLLQGMQESAESAYRILMQRYMKGG